MTNRTMLFCGLALSVAVISTSMVSTSNNARPAAPAMKIHPAPIHSLTGVSFHAVAGL